MDTGDLALKDWPRDWPKTGQKLSPRLKAGPLPLKRGTIAPLEGAKTGHLLEPKNFMIPYGALCPRRYWIEESGSNFPFLREI